MAGGRRSKYESNILPYLDYIDKQLNNGATEKQVAKSLNISYASWNNYKLQFKELADLCAKPRCQLVDQLRGKLVERALGTKVEEKKTYIKQDNDGKETKYTEITIKELPPDTTAIFGALNLYDKDYVKDRKNYELKQQELELRKQLNENSSW